MTDPARKPGHNPTQTGSQKPTPRPGSQPNRNEPGKGAPQGAKGGKSTDDEDEDDDNRDRDEDSGDDAERPTGEKRPNTGTPGNAPKGGSNNPGRSGR